MVRRLPIGLKLGVMTASVLLVAFTAIFFVVREKLNSDLELLMFKQAQALSQQIVLTRKWAANHGGVYVAKRPGVETNPFLYQVGPGAVVPEIRGSDGKVYTLKNPALITRELSELTNAAGLVRYRITSQKAVNPANAPDEFEVRALQRFSQGAPLATEVVREQGRPVYRYAVPLQVDQSCLACHGNQGYQVGDIRGALSLLLPMDTELAFIARRERSALAAGGVLFMLMMASLTLGGNSLITRPVRVLSEFAARHMGGDRSLPPELLDRSDEIGELSRKMEESSRELGKYQRELEGLVAERTVELESAKTQLDELSRTDPLTGLNNRRHLQSEAPKLLALAKRQTTSTAVMMLDIDHFKEFNDTYGHVAGDMALVHVAGILKKDLRLYDLLVRFGGEEFLLLLPISTVEEADAAAERIRRDIECSPVLHEGEAIPLTISIGLYADKSIVDLESAIRQADEALYEAKRTGRNRVCSVPVATV